MHFSNILYFVDFINILHQKPFQTYHSQWPLTVLIQVMSLDTIQSQPVITKFKPSNCIA